MRHDAKKTAWRKTTTKEALLDDVYANITIALVARLKQIAVHIQILHFQID